MIVAAQEVMVKTFVAKTVEVVNSCAEAEVALAAGVTTAPDAPLVVAGAEPLGAAAVLFEAAEGLAIAPEAPLVVAGAPPPLVAASVLFEAAEELAIAPEAPLLAGLEVGAAPVPETAPLAVEIDDAVAATLAALLAALAVKDERIAELADSAAVTGQMVCKSCEQDPVNLQQ